MGQFLAVALGSSSAMTSSRDLGGAYFRKDHKLEQFTSYMRQDSKRLRRGLTQDMSQVEAG
jgi:hypothetical protein